MDTILVIDDEDYIRSLLAELLQAPDRRIITAESGQKALERLDDQSFDLILTDIQMPDLNGFVSGIATLLKQDGVAVIEVPYLRDLIDHCEFDTIYHEHLCYFSVTAVDHLMRRHGLFLNDVRRLPIHGGSLRLFVEKTENRRPGYLDLIAEEKELGLDTIAYYRDFAHRVEQLKVDLSGLLKKLKSEGAAIAAYGAAAKGSTLINYVGIGTDLLDFVADRNVHKQGRFMPGVHVPIVAAERITQWDLKALLSNHPDVGVRMMAELAKRLRDTDKGLRD